jgi:hypothetical protein
VGLTKLSLELQSRSSVFSYFLALENQLRGNAAQDIHLFNFQLGTRE